MSDDDYAVGYRRPPLHSRFQPGQSGNPSGNKRGVRSLKQDLQQELIETVTVRENGKQLKLSKQQLVVKALVSKAAKGDTRAIAKLIDVVSSVFGLAPEDHNAAGPLSQDDEAVMAAAIARAAEREGGAGGPPTR
jgi:hypothetical protein